MRTRHALKPDELLVTGTLEFRRVGPHRRPALIVGFMSPLGDHSRQAVEWPEGAPLDAVVEVPGAGPLEGRKVHVGLDPAHRRRDRETAKHHRERLRAWRREQEYAGRLSEPPRFLATFCDEPAAMPWLC